MKSIAFCSLIGFAGWASAGESGNPTPSPLAESPLLDRCEELANQPLFDFPLSREIGVPINYQWEPAKPQETRIYGFLIAMNTSPR